MASLQTPDHLTMTDSDCERFLESASDKGGKYVHSILNHHTKSQSIILNTIMSFGKMIRLPFNDTFLRT